jgi:hypothetical protein
MKRFTKAERFKTLNRTALCGPAGSGKTFGALLMARGFGGTTALIDTEHGRGQLYARDFEYDVATLGPPYTPERYAHLMSEAEKEGYQNLIIDSITHEWTGPGGILAQHDEIATDPKLNFSAWATLTPKHNAFLDAINASRCHVWCCIRSKTTWVIEKDERTGKHKPVNVGQQPIQRDGVDYEFLVFLQLTQDHRAICTKDLTGIFDQKEYFTITEDTGLKLLGWLQEGSDPAETSRRQAEAFINRIQVIKSIYELRNFWKKHQSSIEAVHEPHQTAVMEALGTKRNDLQSGVTRSQKTTDTLELQEARQTVRGILDVLCMGDRTLETETLEDTLQNHGITGKAPNLNVMGLKTINEIKTPLSAELRSRDQVLRDMQHLLEELSDPPPDVVGELLKKAGLQTDPAPTPVENLPFKVLWQIKPLLEEKHLQEKGPDGEKESEGTTKKESAPKPKRKAKAKPKTKGKAKTKKGVKK